MSSEVVTAAVAAAQRGDPVNAARMLEAAAGNGDGEAAMELAHWRLAGDPIRRDLASAREWFGRAAELGVPGAEGAYVALLANGAGGSGRQWKQALDRLEARSGNAQAQAELALLRAMAIDDDGEATAVPPSETLHEQPLVRTIPGFLSPQECRFLCTLAQPSLQPAVIVDPQTGQLRRDPIRRARSAGFPFVAEPPTLHAINRRIAAATGTTYEQGEPTQILSYEPGEEYKLHSDALAGDPNQRVATFLVTLDDRFEGGATAFPRLGMEWRGRVGDALYFANVDTSGRADPLAWHAGAPVTRGRKVILSKWIRARPLDLSGPPGRPL